ncbi:AFT1 [Candida margitis]|uniref:AFT1 n=1 Tax=Candida margitis TaxID=1775924 RepID=UPI0022269D0E|nr:AFT1 [Candida margitis]KAI5950531.1 AFT1 [Candida margitis]
MSEKVSYRIPLDDLNLESQQFASKDDIKPWLQDAWSLSVMDDRHDHVVDGQEGQESLSPKQQIRQDLPPSTSQEQQQQPTVLSALGTGLNLSKRNMEKKSEMESSPKNCDQASLSNTDQSSSIFGFSNRSSDEFRDSPPTSLNSNGEDVLTTADETSTSGSSASNSVSVPRKRKLGSTRDMNKSKRQNDESLISSLEVGQATPKSASQRVKKKSIDAETKPRRKSTQESTQQSQPPAPHQKQGSKSPQKQQKLAPRRTQKSSQCQQNGELGQSQYSSSLLKPQGLPIPKPQSQTQSLYAIQALQNEVRQKIKFYILDNRNITDNQKTAMLDSFVSQLLIEYRNSFSPQFLHSLKQNLYGREDTSGMALQNGAAPNGAALSGASNTRNFQQSGSLNQPPPSKKGSLNSWLLSNIGDSSGSGASIPLSPLLNDNDGVYAAAAAAAAADGTEGLSNNALDNLSSTPPINGHTSNGLGYANQGNGQLSQIQNQGQQLPPINSIQNKIPTGGGDYTSNGNISQDPQSSTNNMLNNLGSNGSSLGMGTGSGLGVNLGSSNGSVNASANSSTRNSGNFINPSNSLSSSSFFGNASTGNGSLMPPLNPAASTLNPSHILKNGVNNTNGLSSNQMNNYQSQNSQANGNTNNSNLTPLSFNLGKNANPNSFFTSQFNGLNNNNGNNGNQYLFPSPTTNSTHQNNGSGIGNSDKDQGIMLNNLPNYDSGW